MEEQYIYLSQRGFDEFVAQLKAYFVAQVEGMGLTHNDLTDELKQKIENAGDSSFTGNYNDLTSLPTLDDHEIKGTLTSSELGLATIVWVNELIESLKALVSSAVNLKGSCKFAELPEPSESTYRDMYDVTDAFVTDDNFQVGPGKLYHAGTNVVVIRINDDEYKWDVFSGYINTSEFPLRSDFKEITSDHIRLEFAK